MVVQKTLDNLKDRPHDEKKVVAGGIAITVVVILLIGWAFLFLRKVQQEGAGPLDSGALPSDQFNLNLIRQAEQDLRQTYQDSTADLRAMRDDAAANQLPDTYVSPQAVGVDEQNDQFGGSGGF